MEYAGIAIIPLIVGVSEVLKTAGLPTKFIPIINLVLGIAIGIFLFTEDIKKGIVTGLYIGLSAAGLYSGSKHMIREFGTKNKM